MTIIEAIDRIDALKPNSYTHEEKVAWLSQLDGIVVKEVINTHEDSEGIEFNGYDENTDDDTVMLIEPPYDSVYITWLEARIDYANAEYGKYNNSMAMYNTEFTAYANYYNRHHMPLGSKIKFF